jgi:hypothetical protein
MLTFSAAASVSLCLPQPLNAKTKDKQASDKTKRRDDADISFSCEVGEWGLIAPLQNKTLKVFFYRQ